MISANSNGLGSHQGFPMRRRRFLTVLGGAIAGGAAGLWVPRPFDHLLGVREVEAGIRSPFPMDEAVAARVLAEARSRGAGFSELYLEARTITEITLSDGEIESVEQGIFAGCGVRAVDRDRTGYAYADSFDEGPLLAAARDAAAIARSGSAGATEPDAFRHAEPPARVRFARPLDEVPADERVTWLARADREARAYDPSIQQVTVEHTDEMQHFAVINSEGLWIEDVLPLLYMRIDVVAGKNGRRSTGYRRLSKRQGAEQMDGDAAGLGGREAARMAVAMLDAAAAPAGEMPVILGSGGGVMFHEAVGHGLEGDGVRLGTSFYTGRIGEKVASDRVSLIDTGAKKELRGSYNIDDEGTPPLENNLLIEEGVLRGFLTDRISAAALDARLTGSGRRQSYRYPPLVRMSNTFITEGEDSVEEIVRETKSGLFARTLGGGEVDTTTGNFTFGVREGYRIEDGKITQPLRGAVLVGNGPEIMRRIDRVGPDLSFWSGTCGKGQWVPVSSGAPTLRISSMTVGGSEQG